MNPVRALNLARRGKIKGYLEMISQWNQPQRLNALTDLFNPREQYRE
jgi:hypothetical protein